MNNYLQRLAIEVLTNSQEGLSKVKFAKILYFVHKGLVKENLANNNELEFIRMPLGPVPKGFKDLTTDPFLTITEKRNNGLAYNSQVYTLKGGQKASSNREFTKTVSELFHQLNKLSTSELVGKSHHEPSWLQNSNGAEYFLTAEDLEIPLPQRTGKASAEDNYKLQEKLVEGMLDDIVSSSTSLEYPKDNQ